MRRKSDSSIEFRPICGAIDEDPKRDYTHLAELFSAFEGLQNAYNWLITDCDIIAHSERLNAFNDGKYHFLSGEALSEIIRSDDSQWVWGVLSGFDRQISLKEVLTYPLPYADGYPGFWYNPLTLQHPLACVEIVPWDSSLVLILSKEKEFVERFRAVYPACQDLREYNETPGKG